MLLSSHPSAGIPKAHEKPFSNILSGFRRRSSNTILATRTSSSSRLPLARLDPQSVAQSGDNMSSSPSHGIGRPISTDRLTKGEDAENQNKHPIMCVLSARFLYFQ